MKIFHEQKYGACGRFRLDAIRPDGSIRELAGWFNNLITNVGMDYMGGSTDPLLACQVGTGNTAPAFTNTNLASYLAGTTTRTSDTKGIQGTSPSYGWRTIIFQFAQGAAAGNIAEVGVGKTSASGSLFSRALILDGGGSPTTITVLADEILSVTYEFRFYIPEDDVDSSIVISTVTYDTVTRACGTALTRRWADNLPIGSSDANADYHTFTIYNGSLGAITATGPSGANATVASSLAAYVSGNHYIERTGFFSITQGNLAAPGVTACMWASAVGSYQMSFDPPIAKDNTKTLTLVHRVAWDRYTP